MFLNNSTKKNLNKNFLLTLTQKVSRKNKTEDNSLHANTKKLD